jgi:hypothetical protein
MQNFSYPVTENMAETKLMQDRQQKIPIDRIKSLFNVNLQGQVPTISLFLLLHWICVLLVFIIFLVVLLIVNI